jgi:hypothetical protein
MQQPLKNAGVSPAGHRLEPQLSRVSHPLFNALQSLLNICIEILSGLTLCHQGKAGDSVTGTCPASLPEPTWLHMQAFSLKRGGVYSHVKNNSAHTKDSVFLSFYPYLHFGMQAYYHGTE